MTVPRGPARVTVRFKFDSGTDGASDDSDAPASMPQAIAAQLWQAATVAASWPGRPRRGHAAKGQRVAA